MASNDAPIPVSATFAGGGAPVVVAFDQALQAGPALDTANWFVRLANVNRFINAAVAMASRVTITHSTGAPDPGPDVVSFSPPPFDVIGISGLTAQPFTDFPIT